MSNTIDNRIVQMDFNNRQFENNAKESISTLEKLKRGLNLKESSQSLDQVSQAAKRFSVAGMAAGIDSLAQKFSSFGVMGITTIQNLTNRVIDAGIQMGKSLTLDPVTTGFNEYETKMNAIQTLLTNTESKGTNLEDINKALAELNEYADKTIYNFAQMTDNASKFAAQGLGLEDSVTVVKGLSNVAAGFGVNAEKMSAATYQMTQALQPGEYIQLIDWKSMEQAGMGGDKIKKALIATAEGMGIVVDKSKPFNKTLEDGWLKTEVFVETMRKMADDKSLLESAQNVTTFTKLLDTMRESVQSGWASSWENIIGGKDQSTKLFTGLSNAFSEVVGASSAARNAMLKFWNENGGRNALITGLANALLGLASVFKPIEQGFRDIFPPLTGETLIAWSVAFRDLMSTFKLGDTASANLRSTFAGLFAIVDIVLTVFSQFIGLLGITSPLADVFGNTILFVTGTIGNFLVAVKNIIKTFGLFTSDGIFALNDLFRNTFSANIGKMAEYISNGLKYLVDNFNKLGGVAGYAGMAFQQLSMWFDAIVEGIKTLDSYLEPIRVNMLNFVKGLLTFKKNTSDVISGNQNVATSFGGMALSIGGARDQVVGVWEGTINALKKIWSMLDPFKETFMNALDYIKNAIKTNVKNLTGEDILNAAQGLVFSSLLVAIRNFIKTINKSLPEIMKGAVETLDAVRGGLKAWQNQLRSQMIMNLAKGVLILAGAIWILSKIEPEKLKTALVATAVLFGELTLALGLLSYVLNGKVFKTMFQMAIAMTALAVATLILAEAMTKLQVLDWEGVTKGLVSIGGLMLMLVVAVRFLKNGSAGLISISLALLSLSVGVDHLVKSMILISKLSWDEITKGLKVISILFAEIIILSALVNGTNIAQIAVGMLLVAGALYVIAGATAILGNMNVVTLTQGLQVIGLMLVGFALTMRSMPPNMQGTALGILIIAGSLLVMAAAIGIFGNMNVGTILQGLIVISATLIVLSIAVNSMTTAAPGAVALIAVAAALNLLIIPLLTLGQMSLNSIGMAVLAIAASLTVLGLAAYVLGPLAPVMMALSSALALFGGGIALAGLGFIAFTIAIGLLAASIGVIVSVIPTLGKAIRDLLVEITKCIPILGDTIKVLLVEFIALMPTILNVLRVLFDAILTLIIEYVPKIAEAIVLLIIGIADAMRKHDNELKEAVKYLVGVMWEAFKEAIKGLFNIGKQAVDYVCDGLKSRMPGVDLATKKVNENITDGMLGGYKMHYSAGGSIVEGVTDGINDSASNANTAAYNLGTGLIDSTKNAVDSDSPAKEFIKIGTNCGEGLVIGVVSQYPFIKQAGTNLAGTFMDATAKPLEKWSVSGYISGLAEKGASALLLGLVPDKKEKTKIEKSLDSTLGGVGKKGKKGAKSAGEKVKTAFEKSMEWIDDEKYYKRLSLAQELAAYERMLKKYKDGSDEHKKLDREIFRVKNELTKESFDKSIKWMDEKKAYNQLTVKEELSAWERIQSRYISGTEERMKADKEVYRLKNEIRMKERAIEKAAKIEFETSQIESYKEVFEKRKQYNNLSLYEELDGQRELQSMYKFGSKERIDAGKEVFRIQQDIYKQEKAIIKNAKEEAKITKFEDFKKTLELEKAYDKRSLFEKLKYQRDILQAQDFGSKDRQATSVEIVKIEEEIRDKTIAATKQVIEVKTKAKADFEALDDEYYTKQAEINNKLAKDITDLTKTYNDAIKSRSDALYNSYGMFDKVEEEAAVSGTTLIDNLKSQVIEFQSWSSNIDRLTKRGLDKGFLAELEAMGPKSNAKIKGLVDATDNQLSYAVTLWGIKHKEAKDAAIKELGPLPAETTAKIEELKIQAAKDLDAYNLVWAGKFTKLKTDTLATLTALKTDFITDVGVMSTGTVSAFETMVDNAQLEISDPKQPWNVLGASMMDGVEKGVVDNAYKIAAAAAKAARDALQAAKDAIHSKSPSKDFANLGMYAMVGFANGISDFASTAMTATKNAGLSAMDTLRNVISNLSSIVDDNLSTNPVITPVVDLSEVIAGRRFINSALGQGINVGAVAGRLPVVSSPSTQTSQNGSGASPSGLSFVQNNYSPKELSRIEIYRQTRNQLNTMKGLVRA